MHLKRAGNAGRDDSRLRGRSPHRAVLARRSQHLPVVWLLGHRRQRRDRGQPDGVEMQNRPGRRSGDRRLLCPKRPMMRDGGAGDGQTRRRVGGNERNTRRRAGVRASPASRASWASTSMPTGWRTSASTTYRQWRDLQGICLLRVEPCRARCGSLSAERHAFNTEDIEHIRLEAFHEMVLLGAKPPANTEEAQFNTGWAMTMLLLDGQVGPQQMLPARLATRWRLPCCTRSTWWSPSASTTWPTGRTSATRPAVTLRGEMTLRDGRGLDRA